MPEWEIEEVVEDHFDLIRDGDVVLADEEDFEHLLYLVRSWDEKAVEVMVRGLDGTRMQPL